MNEREEFLKKIAELKDLAYLQGGFIRENQISELFPDLLKQQRLVLDDYFKTNHIGIGAPLDAKEYLSGEDNGYLHYYLEELEQMDDVDDAKKRVIIMDALQGDAFAKKELIACYLKNVVDIAKLYTGQGVLLEDLIGEGNVALALAMDMLECVEEIADVEPLLIRYVMNAMEELISNEAEESKKEDKALDITQKVTDKAREMMEELYRKVTVDELAAESGISRKRILEALRISKECLEYIENPSESNEE